MGDISLVFSLFTNADARRNIFEPKEKAFDDEESLAVNNTIHKGVLHADAADDIANVPNLATKVRWCHLQFLVEPVASFCAVHIEYAIQLMAGCPARSNYFGIVLRWVCILVLSKVSLSGIAETVRYSQGSDITSFVEVLKHVKNMKLVRVALNVIIMCTTTTNLITCLQRDPGADVVSLIFCCVYLFSDTVSAAASIAFGYWEAVHECADVAMLTVDWVKITALIIILLDMCVNLRVTSLALCMLTMSVVRIISHLCCCGCCATQCYLLGLYLFCLVYGGMFTIVA